MLAKAALITALYYAAMGCMPCKCLVGKTGKFQYTSLVAGNIMYTFPAGKPFETAATTADTIDKNSYGVKLTFTYDLAGIRKVRASAGLCNAAYACSCREDRYDLADSITHIDIITLSDFDATHPAGSDVSDYFQYVYYDYGAKTYVYMPVNNDLSRLYLQLQQKGNHTLELFLQNDAGVAKAVALDIVMRHKSGKVLTAKPQAVYLR